MRGSAVAWGAALLVVAGCGSDAEPTPAGVKVDRSKPCAAVTQAALGQALGTTFPTAGEASKAPSGVITCEWQDVTENLSVTLTIIESGDRNYDSRIADGPEIDIISTRTKPRLGQDSVFRNDLDSGTTVRADLDVLSGGNEWTFTAVGAPQAQLQPKLLALAKTIFV